MKKQLLELLKTQYNLVELKDFLSEMNTADIADALGELGMGKAVSLFRFLPKSVAAEVFSCLEADEQRLIIKELTDSEVGEIVNNLFADDAADFIEEMPANVVKRVLQATNTEKRAVINQLLRYPDDSAGSIMTTEYVDLLETDTVREAFDRIRDTGVNKETIYTCYVIRRDRLLVGEVSAKTLMLSSSSKQIGDIMNTHFVCAFTTDDQEKAAAQFRKYGLLAMPVVDKEQRLVGIITVDDIVKVIEEENTEDMEKMNALSPSDEPYLKTPVLKLARNRIIWLLVLMLSATLTSGIISNFEDAIAVLPILVAFIPMLMDTGGNAGSQSSTLVIRGIALGEIRRRDVPRVIWRELRVALLCGAVLSIVNFSRIYFMNGKNFALSATVTASLFATVVMAKSIGCILPMIARKLRVDPAIMAAPIITTIVDAAVLIIYFSAAKIVFHI
ncbi:MAG: magnesium transporter [Spirochaetaceae bacterium]|jgi:magnesium transporter|nr:magnesium transporter [Spirochaetaceae bacterium]